MAVEIFFYVLISIIATCTILGGIFVYLITVLVLTFSMIGLYNKNANKMCNSRKRLNGKTVIVTGGTAGMGIKIATDIAARGAKVIITSPFEDEATEVIKYIKEKSGEDTATVVYKKLDLASFKSIRKFAADILATEKQLDILFNNAGINEVDSLTEDGLNKVMQVNYYGTFLLTLLLLPLLKKTGNEESPARIVNTTSKMQYIGSVDEHKNKINYYWWKGRSYANSKLCLMLSTKALAKRLKASNVIVNVVDPGFVGTKIIRTISSGIFGQFLQYLVLFLFKSSWEGCQTALQVALDKEAGNVNGELFQNCQVISSNAYNDEAIEMLWKETIGFVKLSDEEIRNILSV